MAVVVEGLPAARANLKATRDRERLSPVSRNRRPANGPHGALSRVQQGIQQCCSRRAETGSRRRRRGSVFAAADVPDFLPSSWAVARSKKKPLGPSSEFSAEEAVLQQLQALKDNDTPYPDHGVEVMYRWAGFDPWERSRYFGPRFDLGQFERFRRIFHHSTYRTLLGHKSHKVLSTFRPSEHVFKQRVWIEGVRPGEEESFVVTMGQRVGGTWDGYWLTDSIIADCNGLDRGIAY